MKRRRRDPGAVAAAGPGRLLVMYPSCFHIRHFPLEMLNLVLHGLHHFDSPALGVRLACFYCVPCGNARIRWKSVASLLVSRMQIRAVYMTVRCPTVNSCKLTRTVVHNRQFIVG